MAQVRVAGEAQDGLPHRLGPRRIEQERGFAVTKDLADVLLIRRDDRPSRRHVFEDLQRRSVFHRARLQGDVEPGDESRNLLASLQAGEAHAISQTQPRVAAR